MSGKSIRSILIVFCLCLGLNLYGCSVDPELYSQEENWAYLETEVSDPKADVFFLCPSVYSGDEDSYNMSLRDKETKASFVGAINMEKGIYDDEDDQLVSSRHTK